MSVDINTKLKREFHFVTPTSLHETSFKRALICHVSVDRNDSKNCEWYGLGYKTLECSRNCSAFDCFTRRFDCDIFVPEDDK